MSVHIFGKYFSFFNCSYCYYKKRLSREKASNWGDASEINHTYQWQMKQSRYRGKERGQKGENDLQGQIMKVQLYCNVGWMQILGITKQKKWQSFTQWISKTSCLITSIQIPTRLLDEEEEETFNHIVEFSCSNAAGRIYMFKQMVKFISSMKVEYL